MLHTFDEPSPQGITPSEIDVLALYVKSDLETRIEILTSHPQVAGFVFLEKGMLTKAYFPKKVRDWSSTTTKHSVAALTGCPSSHTAFSVDDTDLGGDNTYLVDTPRCHESVKHISVTKFLKDNKKELPTLPSWSDTDLKRVKLVVFPTVIPFFNRTPLLKANWPIHLSSKHSKTPTSCFTIG